MGDRNGRSSIITSSALAKQTTISWTRVFGLAAAIMLAGAQPGLAQYPDRNVVMVSPYTAGGGADLIARLAAQQLAQRLGQSVTVENRLGAGGVVAAASVAKSQPDGYTLFMATSTQLAIQVTLHKKLAYDPTTDFEPIALVAGVPFVLIVHPSVPVNDLAGLLKLAKEKPGQLMFGSAGPGGPPHLYMQLLMSMTGTQMTHIPYKGTSQAINDLIAGTVPMVFSDVAAAVELIKAGKVRPLGVSSKERAPALPDVPTIAEAGVPGFDATAWMMLVAPAKTPNDIIAKLHREAKAAEKDTDFQRKLIGLGLLPLASPPTEELKNYVKSEVIRWGDVVRAAGIAGSQ
jgi:tripartite-type tricarboxylate transporter receptor subunit TctC